MIPRRRSTLIFIVLTVLIDTAGFGIIFPVLPRLIADLGHTGISAAASYGGWLSFAYAAMQFIFAPVLGNLSDAYGRRPVLLCALLGFSIDAFFLAFAPGISWLFVGRIISGIAGASYVVGVTYMADISEGEERTRGFGILNAAFATGFILGPAIGGLLAQFGTRAPFIAAGALGMLNFLFGCLVLPESLAKENRRAFEWKRANPFGAVRQLNRFPGTVLLVAAILLLSFANHSMEAVWAYFTIEKFRWTEQLIGLSLGLIGLLGIAAQGWFVGVVVARLRERNTAYLGLALTCLAFLWLAFAAWQWGVPVGIVLLAMGSIAETAMQGMLSNRVPANAQGGLQGSLGSLKGITAVVSPPLMAGSFAFFTGKTAPFHFPGMPFVIAGASSFISLLLLAKGNRKG